MAETQELDESMVVGEGENDGDGITEGGEGPQGVVADGAAPKRPRAKRASVKSVEGRVAALEQRVEAFTQQLGQLTRTDEQLAQLSGRIARLEEGVARRSGNGGGTVNDDPGIAEQVQQLDERLQKIANVLAQQNWSR